MYKSIFTSIFLMVFAAGSSAQHEIGEGLSSGLDGKTIAYEYSGGRHYEIRFEDGNVTYHRTNGDNAREWRSLVPYNARLVGAGEYYVGWNETDRKNHVTLLLQLNQNKLYSSALLGDYDLIHFQEGRITSIDDE
jgi:phenolic acid decarboxylase